MNAVDVVVLATMALYAVGGLRNGALTGGCSILGFLAGAIVGARVARPLSGSLGAGAARYPIAMLTLVVCAGLGQLIGGLVAGRLRARLTWAPARAVDATLGAVLSAVGVGIVVWMLALPLASSPVPQLSREVRQSRVVAALDDAMPAPVRSAYSSVRELAERNGFPQVFGSLQPTHIRDVPAPDDKVRTTAAVRRVRASVVKVYATSGCDRGSEGSGFVYAPGRVMTNAHVVAGLSAVSVVSGTTTVAAEVVLFDPRRDVAVLSVPLARVGPALGFAGEPAATGASAIVLGFPQDGPFDARAARIRERSKATGETIYGRDSGAGSGEVTREIYSLRAVVRAGNSGGPLLDTRGRVLGVVFARAVDASDTGFALTAAEVAPDARTGRKATAQVDTGACLAT